MTNLNSLQYGQYYHIFNRGNNRENLFLETRNYQLFLRLYTKYIVPIATTLAYCLLRNHFHLFVQIKDPEEIQKSLRIPEGQIEEFPSLQFGHLFNAYTKSINKAYQRTGSLFEKPFKRVPVLSDAHFTCLIAYIHQNPQKHGFVEDFRTWPYSSFQAIQQRKHTYIDLGQVLDWFEGVDRFIEYHLSIEGQHQNIDYLIKVEDDPQT